MPRRSENGRLGRGGRSGAFARLFIRRLAGMLAVVIGVTLIAFALTYLLPGDPIVANLGDRQAADPVAVEAFKRRYGLDQPIPAQYAIYLRDLLSGDLGLSIRTHRAVAADLGAAIPATVELGLSAMVLSILVGVPLGVAAAIRRASVFDQVIRAISLAYMSIPVFWLALVTLYALSLELHLLPGGGRLDPGSDPPPAVTGLYTVDALLAGDITKLGEVLRHLILPASVLGAYNVARITRFTRSAVLEVIEQDFVVAARAKGLSEGMIIRSYVVRAAVGPLITLLGLVFAEVITGAVLTETVFTWPGLGQYAFLSSITLDLKAIMGVSLIVAVVYVAVNFVVDIAYASLDPRNQAG